jgi:hypothetical protein
MVATHEQAIAWFMYVTFGLPRNPIAQIEVVPLYLPLASGAPIYLLTYSFLL